VIPGPVGSETAKISAVNEDLGKFICPFRAIGHTARTEHASAVNHHVTAAQPRAKGERLFPFP
jgi:hypothetical protein